MIDLGGTLKWARDHWLECVLGAGGIAAAGWAAYTLWRQWSAPKIPQDDREAGLSIIVPTLNEEKTLSLLLASISRQKFSLPLELIIVDGGRSGPSKDTTHAIAMAWAGEHDADLSIILVNDLPSKARNVGASHSKYRHLLFLDADTELTDDDFLEKMIDMSAKNEVQMGTFKAKPKASGDLWVDAWYSSANTLFQMKLASCGGYMYFRANAFFWLSGFREDLTINDDYDLGERAKEAGLRIFCFSLTVLSDERRLKKEGLPGLTAKYIQGAVNRAAEKVGLVEQG
ncbi:MAG: glycosyltransferase, partial [Burkholderiales bacterium]